jgi:hypothetical protein
MKPFPYSATSIQAGRNKTQENIFAGIGEIFTIWLEYQL